MRPWLWDASLSSLSDVRLPSSIRVLPKAGTRAQAVEESLVPYFPVHPLTGAAASATNWRHVN